MRISFDFDGTLTEPHIQQICKNKLHEGHDVFIITKRYKNPSEAPYVYQLAESLGINEKNIYFTDRKWKHGFIHFLEINEHYEDEPYEKELIEENTNCKVIMINEQKKGLIL